MVTTPELKNARVFPNHRALIDEIIFLQNEKWIDGYSIHLNGNGVSAGVRKGNEWGYLA